MLKALSRRSFIHLAWLCFFIDLFKFSVSKNVLSSPKLSVCIAGLNDLTADFKMLVFETMSADLMELRNIFLICSVEGSTQIQLHHHSVTAINSLHRCSRSEWFRILVQQRHIFSKFCQSNSHPFVDSRVGFFECKVKCLFFFVR